MSPLPEARQSGSILRRLLLVSAVLLVAAGGVLYLAKFRTASGPSVDKAVNPEVRNTTAYAVWGELIPAEQARELMNTETIRAKLQSSNGVVEITPDLLKLGRKAFYEETFGNEFFVTDILGLMDGPLTIGSFTKAIAALGGKGTSNLRVPLAWTVTVGGKTFQEGTYIDTGLDVPKGAVSPLGIAIGKGSGERARAGLTCAACHSTVDPQNFQVIHGAPNIDLNAGVMAALAPNTASFYAHADFEDVRPFIKDPSRTIIGTNGERIPVPDPHALENAVDAALLKWPRGSFDSMTDLKGDPTQIPSSFTREAHPYGWTGFSAVGPFRGLSVLNNNVHGLNSDPFTTADGAPALFRMDKELYLAILLQNASNPKMRFNVNSALRPSAFLATIDPTPKSPALNQLVPLPTFPKGSILAPTGLWASSPGYRVWEQINAMSAWQNTLVPPKPAIEAAPDVLQMGRAVFERAKCADCHSGPALTNNRVLPVDQVRTEPVRAKALERTKTIMTDPVGWAFDQKVPLPEGARSLKVPPEQIDPEQTKLAYGWDESPGGYKVQSLVGLYWTPPYLHDGEVAVGADASTQVGIPGTLLKNISPDPHNSLRALIDRQLRQQVIAANEGNPDLKAMNTRGIGHEFWADTGAGFSPEEQRALILYLLTYRPPWAEQR